MGGEGVAGLPAAPLLLLRLRPLTQIRLRVGRDDRQRRGGAAAARPLARRDANGRVHLALAASLHPSRGSRLALRPALALSRALQHRRDRRVLCGDAGGTLGGAAGGRGSHCSCPYPYSASASFSSRRRARYRRQQRRR